MYNINILNDFDLEPWKISLGIRCKEFEQAIANNKKVSLMIYEEPIHQHLDIDAIICISGPKKVNSGSVYISFWMKFQLF